MKTIEFPDGARSVRIRAGTVNDYLLELWHWSFPIDGENWELRRIRRVASARRRPRRHFRSFVSAVNHWNGLRTADFQEIEP